MHVRNCVLVQCCVVYILVLLLLSLCCCCCCFDVFDVLIFLILWQINTWAEMGQSLSRRGSRHTLSPRAVASAIASNSASASSSAPVDSAGMTAAAQRLLLLASTSAGESAVSSSANKDGSDDDDEDEEVKEEEEEEEEEEEDGQAVMRFFQQQQRHERRAEVRGTSTEVEARRQQLIENLIGMGFPIDWSLRAAEHCDANVSESVAIAWIIERMELEHAKMEEMDGGEDSRMMAEDMEESDEQSAGGLGMGLGLEEETGTSTLALAAAQHRASYGFHGAHGMLCNSYVCMCACVRVVCVHTRNV